MINWLFIPFIDSHQLFFLEFSLIIMSRGPFMPSKVLPLRILCLWSFHQGITKLIMPQINHFLGFFFKELIHFQFWYIHSMMLLVQDSLGWYVEKLTIMITWPFIWISLGQRQIISNLSWRNGNFMPSCRKYQTSHFLQLKKYLKKNRLDLILL